MAVGLTAVGAHFIACRSKRMSYSMWQFDAGDTTERDMVPEAALEPERDVRAHIRQLFLDQLQKTAETHACHSDGRGEGGGGSRSGDRWGDREALTLRM